MSKKNFIALADMIREHNVCARRNDQYTTFTVDQLELLARFCAKQNDSFKRQRWIDYVAGLCGPNGGAIGK